MTKREGHQLIQNGYRDGCARVRALWSQGLGSWVPLTGRSGVLGAPHQMVWVPHQMVWVPQQTVWDPGSLK
jgi:hypothetical protein